MKVVPRIFGGIGNQLFIYAAARRLAVVNNAELVLDDRSGFAWDERYQRQYQLDHFAIPCRKATALERLEPFSRIRRYAMRRWNERRPFQQRSYLRQEGLDFDPRLLNIKPRGRFYLEGYWQSEDYFKDVEDTIRQDLRILPPTDTRNLLTAKQIQQRIAVGVHVRFFDDPNSLAGNNTPRDYYERAVAAMETRVEGAHYFVFSDNPEAARTRIPMTDARVTVVAHNRGDACAYADLWLMTQCRHFIIANSTFSWWGAWLAENPDKVIVTPIFKKHEGASSRGFRGFLPDKWVRL